MEAENDAKDKVFTKQEHELEDQYEQQSTTWIAWEHTGSCVSSTGSNEPSRNLALSRFLYALLEENASLSKVEIALDRAAILPDKRSQSCIVLQSHSSSASSMPELSRWDSHSVRTPQSVLLEREERLEKEQKAAFHASPTRPQRRTSFEVDRTNEKLECGEATRRAMSQSLSQLSSLQEGDVEKLCKSTLPPRVPIRRSSGRVQSPPPPDADTRSGRQQGNDYDSDEDEGRMQSSFQLEFSESDRYEDDLPVFQVPKDPHPLTSSIRSTEDDTPRRPASYVDRKLRGSRNRSMSPSHFPNSSKNKPNSHPRHRRASLSMDSSMSSMDGSMTFFERSMEALPQLEGFSNPPHQRVLPRQAGALHLLPPSNQNNEGNTAHDDDTDLGLAKLDSQPKPISFDVGENNKKSTSTSFSKTISPNSPTTVEKAVKTTILGRMKNKVKDKLKPRGRSKSPIPRSQAASTS